MTNYYRSIVTCIDYNDYVKLEEILNKPDVKDNFIPDLLLSRTIDKQNRKCFDLIFNYIVNDFELESDDTFECSYNSAFKLYNKVKNEENEYYLKKLIDEIEILYFEPNTTLMKHLYNYDINIYKDYIELMTDDYQYNYEDILECIIDNTLFNESYFMELFDNISKEIQIDFIKNLYINITQLYYKDKRFAFDYFINHEEFNYNKLMLTSKENFIKYNLVNRLVYLNPAYIISCVKYLNKNPVDYKDFDTFTLDELNKLNMFYYEFNKNIKSIKKLLKLVKKPLIINCPKIKLLHSISNYYTFGLPKIDNNNNYIFINYYLYHRYGYNFDIYEDLDINNFNKFTLCDKQKRYIVEIIRFGKYIGQDIPKRLRAYIYHLCDNNELLDIEISNEEIKNMLEN